MSLRLNIQESSLKKKRGLSFFMEKKNKGEFNILDIDSYQQDAFMQINEVNEEKAAKRTNTIHENLDTDPGTEISESANLINAQNLNFYHSKNINFFKQNE